MKQLRYIKRIFLIAVFFGSLNGIKAQSSLNVSHNSSSPSAYSGDTISYHINLSSINGFNQQVYLSVSSPTLTDSNFSYNLSASTINYPYANGSDLVMILKEVNVSGLYTFVVSASNGPISVRDSIKLYISSERRYCAWQEIRPSLPSGYMDKSFMDRNNARWYINEDLYLVKNLDGHSSSYKIPGTHNGGEFHSKTLVFDIYNNVWINNTSQLLKFDGTFWTIFDKSNSSIPSANIVSIDADSKGNIWMATIDAGIVAFKDGIWSSYNTSNSDIPNNACRQIKVDREDNVWATSYNSDYQVASILMKLINNKWEWYTNKSLCISGEFFNLNFDHKNNLWMTTSYTVYAHDTDPYFISNALIKFDGKQWEQWFSYKTPPYNHIIRDSSTCNIISKDNNSNFQGGILDGVFIDNSGNTWLVEYNNQGPSSIHKYDGINWYSYNSLNSVIPPGQGSFSLNNYAENNSDTLFYSINGKTYFFHCPSKRISSIAGIVHEANGFMNTGIVEAIEVNTKQTYLTTSDNEGNFFLDSLAKGNYILRAIPSGNAFNTTYYPNASVEADAYVLNLKGQITDIDIYLNTITGIEDGQSTSRLLISPNPFTDRLEIKNYSQELEITDITGAAIFKGKIQDGTIDTGNWNAGMYLLKIKGSVYKIMKVQ